MRQVNIWEVEIFQDKYIDNLDELLQKIKEGHKFIIKDNHKSLDDPTNKLEHEHKDCDFIYTNEKYIAFLSPFEMICENMMNSQFYEKNKEQIEKAKIYHLLHTSTPKLNEENYSFELLKNILDNGIFEELTIKNITLNSNELTYIFDSKKNVISYNEGKFKKLGINGIIGNCGLENIDSEIINVNFKLEENDLINFKYITNNTKFKFDFSSELTDYEKEIVYENIIKTIDKLKQLNKTSEIIINIKNLNNRQNILQIKNKLKEYENINIYYGLENHTLNHLIKVDDKLKQLVANALDKSYSPLEIFLYLYDVVKQYKQYKENPKNKDESRNIDDILFNEYIVCAGYANLLIELLNMANIEAIYYSVSVDISYDNGFTLEEKTLENAGHAKVCVHIKDEKYKLDNYFVSDPTWDNNMQMSTYIHALRDLSSTRYGKRLMTLNTFDRIFDIDNFEDYNAKLNNYFDRNINSEKGNDKQSVYRKISYIIMDYFKMLDKQMYEQLLPQYTLAQNTNQDIVYDSFFTQVGQIILKKSNKKVEDDLLFEAIFNMKQKIDNNITREDINKMRIQFDDLSKEAFPYKQK